MPPPIPTIEVRQAIAAMTSISSTLFICVEVCFGEMSAHIKHSIYSRDITRREFYVLLPLVI